MATFNTIGLEEPSSITKELAAVTVQRNSSNTEQELITLADPESSLGLLRITDGAPDSTMFGAVVRQIGYVAPSTTVAISSIAGRTLVDQNSTTWPVQVSSVAGAVTIRSSAANALVSVYQSTATDLRARVDQGVGNSSLGDRWLVDVANSSATDYLPVRIVDSSGTGFLTPGNEYTAGSTYSSHAGPTISFNNSSNDTYRTVGVTTPLPTQILSSSGGNPYDSTNRAVNVNVVAGAASGSTIVTVSTGSVRVHQSSAADLNVTVSGYSTTVNVSSLGGAVIVRSSAANHLATVYQSSAADLAATVTLASTGNTVLARLTTSSGGGLEGSTAAPAATALGLHTRQVVPTLLSTTVVITSSNSTALYSLVSSAAGLRHKVYAYFVASTHTSPSTLVFMSSNAIDRWPVTFGSGSSGITGANLAVSPPAWIFATDAANALQCRIENVSTQVIARVGIAYFTEA